MWSWSPTPIPPYSVFARMLSMGIISGSKIIIVIFPYLILLVGSFLTSGFNIFWCSFCFRYFLKTKANVFAIFYLVAIYASFEKIPTHYHNGEDKEAWVRKWGLLHSRSGRLEYLIFKWLLIYWIDGMHFRLFLKS